MVSDLSESDLAVLHGFHPAIREKLLAQNAAACGTIDLAEAVEAISIRGSWRKDHMKVLGHATIVNYKHVLKSLSGNPLRAFMSGLFRTTEVSGHDYATRKHAADTFVAACVEIWKESGESAIGRIIERELRANNLGMTLITDHGGIPD